MVKATPSTVPVALPFALQENVQVPSVVLCQLEGRFIVIVDEPAGMEIVVFCSVRVSPPELALLPVVAAELELTTVAAEELDATAELELTTVTAEELETTTAAELELTTTTAAELELATVAELVTTTAFELELATVAELVTAAEDVGSTTAALEDEATAAAEDVTTTLPEHAGSALQESVYALTSVSAICRRPVSSAVSVSMTLPEPQATKRAPTAQAPAKPKNKFIFIMENLFRALNLN